MAAQTQFCLDQNLHEIFSSVGNVDFEKHHEIIFSVKAYLVIFLKQIPFRKRFKNILTSFCSFLTVIVLDSILDFFIMSVPTTTVLLQKAFSTTSTVRPLQRFLTGWGPRYSKIVPLHLNQFVESSLIHVEQYSFIGFSTYDYRNFDYSRTICHPTNFLTTMAGLKTNQPTNNASLRGKASEKSSISISTAAALNQNPTSL